jgi:uroporphyrinogen decarboxylase
MTTAEMTSREIVQRCIEFRDPPRIAMHFAVDPIDGRTWPFTDFGSAAVRADPDFVIENPHESEWGVVMETLDPTSMGEPRGNPLAEGWHLLDSYRFPDFSKPVRYAGLREEVAALHARGKYVVGHIPSLMLLPAALRGIENWFLDHVLEKASLCRLLDMIVDARLTTIEHYHAAGLDAVITWDDMGTNERVFVSPATFREIYLPRYKRTNDALHERGMHFVHHCCGHVRDYMDMFVEGGCDVLQLDQPELMGVEWLGEHYGGKLCFWNPVDIQTTMPTGDEQRIEEEAHRQVWHLGNFGGGFMVKAYQQPNAVGITVAASEAQYQAFLKYASYPLVPFPAP